MLINTVILFIKDILPIGIMICFLSICIAPSLLNKRNLFYVSVVCLVGVIVSFKSLAVVNDLFDGGGIEIFQSTALILVYVCLVFGSRFFVSKRSMNDFQNIGLLLALVIFAVLNLSEFLLFFTTYASDSHAIISTTVGALFGFGICLSFCALFAIAIGILKRKNEWIMHCIWAFYLAGLVSQVLYLLQQIDVVNVGETIWNTSMWVSDSSEYGYLLNTMFGYVSAPTFEYCVVYVMSLMVYLVYYFKFNQNCLIESERVA